MSTSHALTPQTECTASAPVVFGVLIFYLECVILLCESVREHMAGLIKSSPW